MELQLGLSLATTTHTCNIESCLNLKDNGLEPKEKVGSESWSRDVCLDNKRSFEKAFGKMKDAASQLALPLLLWSGQPNDEDDWNAEKKRISCSITQNEEEEKHLVGWPPIKSWRKKMLHLHQHQHGHVANNRVAGNENGGSNSMYVKVKMEGAAITRKIDLRLYNSYQTLTNSLISMFADCHKIEKNCTLYTLTYQDKDGDWLLAGDVPWQTFRESVQRLELRRNGG